jgi:hypothetical protein
MHFQKFLKRSDGKVAEVAFDNLILRFRIVGVALIYDKNAGF